MYGMRLRLEHLHRPRRWRSRGSRRCACASSAIVVRIEYFPLRRVRVRGGGLVELGGGDGPGEAREGEQLRRDGRLSGVDAEVGEEPLRGLRVPRELPDRVHARVLPERDADRPGRPGSATARGRSRTGARCSRRSGRGDRVHDQRPLAGEQELVVRGRVPARRPGSSCPLRQRSAMNRTASTVSDSAIAGTLSSVCRNEPKHMQETGQRDVRVELGRLADADRVAQARAACGAARPDVVPGRRRLADRLPEVVPPDRRGRNEAVRDAEVRASSSGCTCCASRARRTRPIARSTSATTSAWSITVVLVGGGRRQEAEDVVSFPGLRLGGRERREPRVRRRGRSRPRRRSARPTALAHPSSHVSYAGTTWFHWTIESEPSSARRAYRSGPANENGATPPPTASAAAPRTGPPEERRPGQAVAIWQRARVGSASSWRQRCGGRCGEGEDRVPRDGELRASRSARCRGGRPPGSRRCRPRSRGAAGRTCSAGSPPMLVRDELGRGRRDHPATRCRDR